MCFFPFGNTSRQLCRRGSSDGSRAIRSGLFSADTEASLRVALTSSVSSFEEMFTPETWFVARTALLLTLLRTKGRGSVFVTFHSKNYPPPVSHSSYMCKERLSAVCGISSAPFSLDETGVIGSDFRVVIESKILRFVLNPVVLC